MLKERCPSGRTELYVLKLPVLLSVYFMVRDVCKKRNTGKMINVIVRVKVKVKVTLVQALMLCTGRMADRGSRGIALLFYDQRH